jgi:hypothetical protein
MTEQSKNLLREHIKGQIESIKNVQPKIELQINPSLLVEDNIVDKEEISNLLIKLRRYYDELFPLLKKIKNHITDITEKTHICAVYLTLCNVFNFWNSFFILAEQGRGIEAGSLLRVIKEGNMQADLFITEAMQGNRAQLDRWLEGEIMTHGEGRKKVSNFMEIISPNTGDEFKILSTQTYQIESQAAHNAYEAILENVSPFTEDYDFDGYSNYFHTISWIKYAHGSLQGTNITLKGVYIYLKDNESHEKLDEILIRLKTNYS